MSGELYVRGLSAGSMLHLSIGEEGAAAGVLRRHAAAGQLHHPSPRPRHLPRPRRRAGPDDGRDRRQGERLLPRQGRLDAHRRHGARPSRRQCHRRRRHPPSSAPAHSATSARAATPSRSPSSATAPCKQGVLYESMNMAALWELPVLFVCINNQYGMGTRIDRATRSTAFDKRAEAFGLEAAMVDGEDVEAVFQAAQGLIDAARTGRPGLHGGLLLPLLRPWPHGQEPISQRRGGGGRAQARPRRPCPRRSHPALPGHGARSSTRSMPGSPGK